MSKVIDKENEINVSELTFANLSEKYGTGRSYHISGEGRYKKHGYRAGIMTELGDIEISLWEQLVHKLIALAGEQKLYENLVSWCGNIKFLRDKDEVKLYALKLHASRIFDDEKWADYEAFNSRFRPDKLKK